MVTNFVVLRVCELDLFAAERRNLAGVTVAISI